MQTERKCKICGKPYEAKALDVLGVKKTIYVSSCDCLEKLEAEREEFIRKKQFQQKLDEIAKISSPGSRFLKRTFDNWKKSPETQEIFNRVKHYALNFERMRAKGQGCMLVGDPGNGKTHLAVSAYHYLREQGYLCIYIPVSEFLDRIDYLDKSSIYYISNLLDAFKRLDLVIFDDFGKEKYTETRLSSMYKIINTLYEHEIPVFATMNYEADQKLNSNNDLKAVNDRVVEMCRGFIFENPAGSYRKRLVG